MANLIISSGRCVRRDLRGSEGTNSSATGSVPNENTRETLSEERVSQNVGMRLRDADKKFSGHLGECWMEYIDNYFQVAHYYKHNAAQRIEYLHNILSNDSQRFYLDRFQTYAINFQQTVDMINKNYNSPVTQTRMKHYLNSLQISEFVSDGL